MIKGIPRRHFTVSINRDAVGLMDALATSFEKNGFVCLESPDLGVFHHRDGMVKFHFYERVRNRPEASVWCFSSNENATMSEIEAFAELVEKTIQVVPDIKVKRDDSLLYEKRYAIVKFPDNTFRWVEPPGLWLDHYLKEPVISYIKQKMQIDLRYHRKFFETFLARPPDKRWTDMKLDLLHHYHYSTIFWLAASRRSLDKLVSLVGITEKKPIRLKGGSFKFELQTALCAFLTNMCSALDALAQIVNLMCLKDPKQEENVYFTTMLGWMEESAIWKLDFSRLRRIFRLNGKDTSLVRKLSEMRKYRNIVVHRRLMPLIETVSGTYTVEGEAGRLLTRDETGLTSSQTRSVAVHIPRLEADVDKGLALIAITVSERLFLPKLRKKELVYGYPIDRSHFRREDVLLLFEKYYEYASSLIEKVYATLLDMKKELGPESDLSSLS